MENGQKNPLFDCDDGSDVEVQEKQEDEKKIQEELEKQATQNNENNEEPNSLTPLSFSDDEKKPVKFFGILNDINLDYAISTIQCFIRIAAIRQFFNNKKQNFTSSQPVSLSYQRLIKKAKESLPNINLINIALKKLKTAVDPKFRGTTHEDAREFLIKLIDKLQSENNENKKCNVLETLNCKIASSVTCLSCDRIIDQTIDEFSILDLNIADNETLDECIQKVVSETVIERTCQFCNGNEAKKKSVIINWPNYLILSLNRNKKAISCTENLQIEKFSNRFTGSYSLFGIIFHEGTAESGHYFVVVKSMDEWNLISDEDKSPADINDYLIDNRTCILFYKMNP